MKTNTYKENTAPHREEAPHHSLHPHASAGLSQGEKCRRPELLRRGIRLLQTLLLLFLSSCTSDTPSSASKLAMEAWIDTDGYPVVILTRTLQPGDDDIPLSDAVARFAKVTITDGTDTFTLTGGVDYTVFPPYSYRNFDMKGKPDQTYTVTARYDNMQISATSRMLTPPSIDSLKFTPVDGSDSLRTGRIFFTPAPSDTISCYVVFTRVRNRELRHYPAMLGTAETKPHATSADLPLSRGINILDDFSPNFVKGDTLDVILAHVEPRVYSFWQAYNDAVYLGDNIFVSSSLSLPTNVTGGLGIFSARATARRLTHIP